MQTSLKKFNATITPHANGTLTRMERPKKEMEREKEEKGKKENSNKRSFKVLLYKLSTLFPLL